MRKKLLKLVPFISLTVFYPTSAFAVSDFSCFSAFQNDPRVSILFEYITCTIERTVIPLLFAIALVIFIWGVVQYVINSDQEEKKAKGRQFMILGFIPLAVLISVWGLVRILGNSFRIDYAVPQIKGNR